MAQLADQSRRTSTRFAVTGQLDGKWVGPAGQAIDILPVDISALGLGALINPAFPASSKVYWHRPEKKAPLEFVIAWSFEPAISHDFSELLNMCRCGLRLISDDLEIDLVELCKTMPTLH